MSLQNETYNYQSQSLKGQKTYT